MYSLREGHPFYQTLRILALCGLYIEKADKKSIGRYELLWVAQPLLFFLTVLVPTTLHMVVIVREKIDINIAEDVTIAVSGVSLIMTLRRSVVSYNNLLHPVLHDMADYRRFGKPPKMDNVIKRCNTLSILYVLYIWTGALMYAILAHIDAKQCRKISANLSINTFCGTYLPFWLPFDMDTMFIFWYQMVLTMWLLVPDGIYCYIYYELVEVLMTRKEHLDLYLEDVFREADIDRRRQKLKLCVDYHAYILSIAEKLVPLLSRSIGHLPFLWAIVFGTIANQIYNSKPLGAIIFLGGYTAALAWLSEAGQTLQDQSIGVSDTLYNLNWYTGSTQEMKDIRFMIARSQISARLPATPFGYYEYSLFVTIMKTAYSYMTLLRR